MSIQDIATLKRTLIAAGIAPKDLQGKTFEDLQAIEASLTSTPTPTATPTPTEPEPMTEPTPTATPTPPATGKLADALQELLAAQQSAPIDEAKIVEMIRAQVSNDKLVQLIKENTSITYTVEMITPKATKKIKGAHKVLKDVLKWLNVREHVYLRGPAGSGKTFLGEQAADALGVDFYSTGALLQKYELTGFVDGRGKYLLTAFREAYENGGLFLFDEMDASLAAALVAFNNALSNDSYTFPDSAKPIKRHEDFYCIAAANTMGTGPNRQYVGRQPLDGATLDRFTRVNMDYDTSLETRLAKEAFAAFGGTDTDLLDTWLADVRRVRKECDRLKISAIISPRASIAGAKGLAAGISYKDVLDARLYSHLSADQLKQIA